jgi:hypothetical protein
MVVKLFLAILLEPVANVAYRFDVCMLRVFDFTAQPSDMHIDSTVASEIIESPYLIQKGFTGKDPTLLLQDTVGVRILECKLNDAVSSVTSYLTRSMVNRRISDIVLSIFFTFCKSRLSLSINSFFIRSIMKSSILFR